MKIKFPIKLLFALILSMFCLSTIEASAQTWTPQPGIYNGTQKQNVAVPKSNVYTNSTAYTYSATNGIRDISPSSQIVKTNYGYSTYNYNNGIRDIAPAQSTVKNWDGTYSIYNHTNGIRDIAPVKIIKIE